ncbi:addiction module protein [Luteolibacter arcticus]|uniref:Addiction module protein n=1 Tax=Luteolibacter arcticus TaxID=1581411 RepID=A0ABT3GCK0_9BACT|nr:addiction module protein [Luteolibacter arcticus]MCW1921337.1 addiction module protein [Luteolibacter arcticus]
MDALILEQEALKLPPLARLRLADLLYSSLEVAADEEWKRKAAEECESRWEAYKRGDIGSTVWTDFLDRIEAKYPRP